MEHFSSLSIILLKDYRSALALNALVNSEGVSGVRKGLVRLGKRLLRQQLESKNPLGGSRS